MGKWSLAATSLVAAVPAGFLSYLMVMVFLERTEKLETPLKVWAGVMLAVSAFVTVLPFGILIFSPKARDAKDAVDEESKKTDAMEAPVDAPEDEMFDEDEAGEHEEEDTEFEDDLSAAEGEELDMEDEVDGEDLVEGFGDDDDDDVAMAEVDTEDIFAEAAEADFDDFDMVDFDDDEEEKRS